jgi:hypothetical protein
MTGLNRVHKGHGCAISGAIVRLEILALEEVKGPGEMTTG